MSRGDSEEKILKALEQVLVEGREAGINAVARLAGLDKVLIYRYFGGWDGLLTRFAERVNLWRPVRQHLESGLLDRRWSSAVEAGIAVFGSYQELVTHSPLFQHVLIWEINHPESPLAKAAQRERETEGTRIIELLGTHFPQDMGSLDGAALGAFIIGSITFFAMKGPRSDPYNGIDFCTEEGWARFRSFWEGVIRRALGDP